MNLNQFSDGELKGRETDVLLNVCDFLLLLVVCLHLIHLVLLLGAYVGGVVTSVVDQLLLHRQIHDVSTHRVHKILGMRGDNENVVVC
jgi:hypothetical protein